MEDLRWLSDEQIVGKIGKKIKDFRLEQNMTRQALSTKAEVSVTTLDKLENGNNFNISTLIRCLRILDRLDILQPLVRERELTPYELDNIVKGKKIRMRASSTRKK